MFACLQACIESSRHVTAFPDTKAMSCSGPCCACTNKIRSNQTYDGTVQSRVQKTQFEGHSTKHACRRALSLCVPANTSSIETMMDLESCLETDGTLHTARIEMQRCWDTSTCERVGQEVLPAGRLGVNQQAFHPQKRQLIATSLCCMPAGLASRTWLQNRPSKTAGLGGSLTLTLEICSSQYEHSSACAPLWCRCNVK